MNHEEENKRLWQVIHKERDEAEKVKRELKELKLKSEQDKKIFESKRNEYIGLLAQKEYTIKTLRNTYQ